MFIQSIAAAILLPTARTAVESVDNRLSGGEVVELSRFLNYPAEASRGKFTPNPVFWGKGIDFSCASPWNSGAGAQRAGTLVSKRHFLCAKHFPLWKGVRMLFVDGDGEVCPCYVEATKVVPKSDIMVGLLNAEVTPNIHPAKILPPNYTNYLDRLEGLPVVTLNQQERAFVSDLVEPSTNYVRDLMCYHRPDDPKRMKCREKIRSGDSGSPVFLIMGNEPILLYCLTTSMGGYGLHFYRSEIQKAMDELCPGYKLETFDFAALERK